MTITLDALDFTVQGRLWPRPPPPDIGHGEPPSPLSNSIRYTDVEIAMTVRIFFMRRRIPHTV